MTECAEKERGQPVPEPKDPDGQAAIEFTPGQERIMDALLRLVERHEPERTLVAIAGEAGYQSKSSIYDHFPKPDTGSSSAEEHPEKRLEPRTQIVLATVQRELVKLHETVPDRSDELSVDLKELAQRYYDYLSKTPFLALMVHEVAGNDFVTQKMQEYQRETAGRLIALYEHHRANGQWSDSVQKGGYEELTEHVTLRFLGPIFSRIVWNQMGIIWFGEEAPCFDAAAHVRAFLAGSGANREREKPVAEKLIAILRQETGLEPSREQSRSKRDSPGRT